MDPLFLSFATGALTNAFSSVVGRSWADATSVDVERIVEKAAEEVAAATTEELDPDRAAQFLENPRATNLVRMLFAAGVNTETPSTVDLRSLFASAFRQSVPEGNDREADSLFRLLAASTEKILQEASRAGDPEAQDALASIRFRHLDEELHGLARSIEALDAATDDNVEAYLEWERLYRDQVLVRHGTITPPSFDAFEPVPVDDIYVETRFWRSPEPRRQFEIPVSRDHLVERLDRLVVLGDPGAGKSTFAMKFAYDLAKGRVEVPGGSSVPLVVTLKDYGAEKAKRQISLVEWIESVVNANYSAPAPKGAIPYLLDAGSAVVILDGLDELLDTSHRQEIAADVETFASRYVNSPIVVTSRRAGYLQAPLDKQRFEDVYLRDFEESQIAKYVDMWFGLRSELTVEEREEMASGFMKESKAKAYDLRGNPLMLALLCNVYRGTGYIPEHRPQVYEKCAVMLFERWDSDRNIKVPLEFERHLRPTMQHLAHWIYSDPSLRDGVREVDLVRATTDYLMTERGYEDEGDARQAAKQFVEFCRGRAWVFTDMGTTGSGERLYQFTHRTFLEFFAAEYLVRQQATADELGKVLYPHIQQGEWDVVAELAFQLKDDASAGAGGELLEGLLASASDDEDGDATLVFAAESLSFLVPGPAVCRRVAEAVVRRVYRWLLELPEFDPDNPTKYVLDRLTDPEPRPYEALVSLAHANRENLEPIGEAIFDGVLAALEADPSQKSAEALLEILPNVDRAQGAAPRRAVPSFWKPIQSSAIERMWPILKDHLRESDPIAYDGVYFGLIGVDEALRGRPADFFFDFRNFELYRKDSRPSLASCFLRGALGLDRESSLGSEAEMEKLGEYLLEAEPPWERWVDRTRGWCAEDFSPERMEPVSSPLEGPALFAGFALLATALEETPDEDEVNLMLDGLGAADGWPQLLVPWIVRRYEGDEVSDDDLPSLPMGDRERQLVADWGKWFWSVVESDPTEEEDLDEKEIEELERDEEGIY